MATNTRVTFADRSRPAALLLLALAAVAAQAAYYFAGPVIVSNDSAGYLRAASGIFETGSFSQLEPVRTPGYPLLVSFLWLITGKGIAPVALAQHMLVALLAAGAALVLSRITAPVTALLAGAAIALDPFLALFAQWILAETAYCVLLTAAVLVSLFAGARPRLWFLAGLLFAACTLVRPSGIIAALCAAFLVAVNTRSAPKLRGRSIAALAAGVMLALGPWLAYRLASGGSFGLAKDESAFLRVQMLQHQGLFEPELLEDAEAEELYRYLVAKRSREGTEQKLYRRGFAFAMREELLKTRSTEEVDKLYENYIARYVERYRDRYLGQAWHIFLNLLHLRNDFSTSLVPAYRYLGGAVSLRKHTASIAESAEEEDFFYLPRPLGVWSSAWLNALAALSGVKPLPAVLFLTFCVLTFASQAVRRELDPLHFLPLLVFVTQAAAYAALLHPDDRYTLVLNPLLYAQTAVAASYWIRRRTAPAS